MFELIIAGILEQLVGNALYEAIGIGKGVEWLKGKGVKNPPAPSPRFHEDKFLEGRKEHTRPFSPLSRGD